MVAHSMVSGYKEEMPIVLLSRTMLRTRVALVRIRVNHGTLSLAVDTAEIHPKKNRVESLIFRNRKNSGGGRSCVCV